MKRGRIIVAFCVGLAWFILIQIARYRLGGMAALVSVPHTVFLALGLIFNVVAMFLGAGWSAIVAGSMYAASISVGLSIGWLLILPATACALSFAAAQRQSPPSQQHQVVHIHHYADGSVVTEPVPSRPPETPAAARDKAEGPIVADSAPARRSLFWLVIGVVVAILVLGVILGR